LDKEVSIKFWKSSGFALAEVYTLGVLLFSFGYSRLLLLIVGGPVTALAHSGHA